MGIHNGYIFFSNIREKKTLKYTYTHIHRYIKDENANKSSILKRKYNDRSYWQKKKIRKNSESKFIFKFI
jgi:hypothetical protein